MAISEQKLISLQVEKLKNLVNLAEIRFDEKPLTAILGVNGCGKSTLLHAMACCYKPVEGSGKENLRFSHFFTPTSDSSWSGSRFTLNHSYRNGHNHFDNQKSVFAKLSDRWSPRYEKRIERHVEYIGIKTCVPRIEDETQTSFISYETSPIEGDVSEKIKGAAGAILKRNYSEFNQHQAARKNYLGLAFNGTRYSSLSMGAGEQRVLHILDKVFRAPKYSLILIDEVDLLLHTEALKELLRQLSTRAVDKSLQIIFTTHREAVLELNSIISIRHLYQSEAKTLCLVDTHPDTLQRLTGVQERHLEVFVEDKMAEAIIRKVAAELGIGKHVSVSLFGAARNCFTVAAGLTMKGDNLDNVLFLLDGDVFRTEDERVASIDSVFVGTEQELPQKKRKILDSIKQFVPNESESPEKALHKMISQLECPAGNEERNEIIAVAKEIVAVQDRHQFIGAVIERMGFNKDVGLSKIADIASSSPYWTTYVAQSREWFVARREQVLEPHVLQAVQLRELA